MANYVDQKPNTASTYHPLYPYLLKNEVYFQVNDLMIITNLC